MTPSPHRQAGAAQYGLLALIAIAGIFVLGGWLAWRGNGLACWLVNLFATGATFAWIGEMVWVGRSAY